MFDSMPCPGCGETNFAVSINDNPIALHCYECENDYSAEDLENIAKDFIRVAAMLRRMPMFEQTLVNVETKVPSMQTPAA